MQPSAAFCDENDPSRTKLFSAGDEQSSNEYDGASPSLENGYAATATTSMIVNDDSEVDIGDPAAQDTAAEHVDASAEPTESAESVESASITDRADPLNESFKSFMKQDAMAMEETEAKPMAKQSKIKALNTNVDPSAYLSHKNKNVSLRPVTQGPDLRHLRSKGPDAVKPKLDGKKGDSGYVPLQKKVELSSHPWQRPEFKDGLEPPKQNPRMRRASLQMAQELRRMSVTRLNKLYGGINQNGGKVGSKNARTKMPDASNWRGRDGKGAVQPDDPLAGALDHLVVEA